MIETHLNQQTKADALAILEKEKAAHPEGCKCTICGEFVPWDDVMMHTLDHPEAWEERPGLTRGQRFKMKMMRKAAKKKFEGKTDIKNQGVL